MVILYSKITCINKDINFSIKKWDSVTLIKELENPDT